jgi:hypothetical protein
MRWGGTRAAWPMRRRCCCRNSSQHSGWCPRSPPHLPLDFPLVELAHWLLTTFACTLLLSCFGFRRTPASGRQRQIVFLDTGNDASTDTDTDTSPRHRPTMRRNDATGSACPKKNMPPSLPLCFAHLAFSFPLSEAASASAASAVDRQPTRRAHGSGSVAANAPSVETQILREAFPEFADEILAYALRISRGDAEVTPWLHSLPSSAALACPSHA